MIAVQLIYKDKIYRNNFQYDKKEEQMRSQKKIIWVASAAKRIERNFKYLTMTDTLFRSMPDPYEREKGFLIKSTIADKTYY